jgi:hypothetical protein
MINGLFVLRSNRMKKAIVALLTVLLVSSAYADGGHGHRGGWGGREHHEGWGWDGSWFLPALIGSAIFLDIARSNTTYVQPEPVYVQPEPIYSAPVNPPSVATAPPFPQVLYFCPETNAYYPYVKSCANGWQAVPATPPQ